MKKALAIALLVLLAFSARIYIVGSFIPVQHTATVTGTYQRSHSEIWSSITDVRSYPDWRINVKRVEVLSDSTPVIRWREYYGDNDSMTFEGKQRADSSVFHTQIVDERLPYSGTWTYKITSDSMKTTVTITEEGEIYSPVFRFVSKYLLRYKKTMNQFLDMLEKRSR